MNEKHDLDIVCVILCGGKGRRMSSSQHHKVCFPLEGTPAIIRTINTLKTVGLKRFLIVVGEKAADVMDTVSRVHNDVTFVYQPTALGTGHAAQCAALVLKAQNVNEHILITMGDKVIQEDVVRKLIDQHLKERADLTLAALPKNKNSTAGRILSDSSSRPLAVIELSDLERLSKTRAPILVAGQEILGDQIESRSKYLNASLYLFRAPILYESLTRLEPDNIQGEFYLTDTIQEVSRNRGLISLLKVNNPEDLMGFNTPGELLQIEEILRYRSSSQKSLSTTSNLPDPACLKPVKEWLDILHRNPPSLQQTFIQIYGTDAAHLKQRINAYLRLMKRFVERHGATRMVILARAPGRINLMGRHVDHRGGFVNVMAINREVIFVASPRDDDTVTLSSLSPHEFPDRSFRIHSLLDGIDWIDWMDFINSHTVRQFLKVSSGDWSNYAQAAVLRLQHACPDRRLAGMDCVVAGDIPVGAGLSSSSALVVAVAEASAALNNLDLTTEQFVDLCGEGEWFVGSRGGSADHAAIRSAEKGKVSKVGFFPFRTEERIPFPEELSVIIANSRAQVSKSEEAMHTFNHRVACYDLAEILLRRNEFLRGSMKHLGDLVSDKLGISDSEIYRLLKQLPLKISRRGLSILLSDQLEQIQKIFSTHDNQGSYHLRGIGLYGLAECQRSKRFSQLLKLRDFSKLGEMMRVSHDGDRIVRHRNGISRPYKVTYSDLQLNRLISNSVAQDPAKRRQAMLAVQPGRYACSTPEIDQIVDLSSAQPQVFGAQLAGAGLGGCAMILTRVESVEKVLSNLVRLYYEERGIAVDIHVCNPVAGSGLIRCP